MGRGGQGTPLQELAQETYGEAHTVFDIFWAVRLRIDLSFNDEPAVREVAQINAVVQLGYDFV
jgi:hypothetical protein